MKIIVFGAKGMLGGELVRQLTGHEVFPLDAEDVDVTNKKAVQSRIAEISPDWIFNCAAYNAVDKAETSPDKDHAFELNATAVGYIAEAAELAGATLIHYSTGFIFDGESSAGYKEDDEPNPISVYGQSKLQGEIEARKCSKLYIIRLNLLFGKAAQSESAKKSFPDLIIDLSKEKDAIDFVDDEISSPTYSVDLAKASIKLAEEKFPYGIYHLPNGGQASWFDFAEEVFRIKGIKTTANRVSSDSFVRPAKRPKNSVLQNTKFPKLRPWREALAEYLQNN